MSDRFVPTRSTSPDLGCHPEYRDSGVEWLGEIPAHWDTRRLKFLARINAGQSPPSSLVRQANDGIPFLQGNAEFGVAHPTPSLSCDSPPKNALPGDILLSVRAPVGALNIADQEYGIGRGLCAITPGMSVFAPFAYQVLMAIRFRLHAVATGSTYEAVAAGDIGNLPVPLPSIAEQRAIADFLDRETARIDALVAKQHELIKLLQEKRTALISHAVTKGLDPDVAMKDSGVEWLGEIPAHWGTRRLKAISDMQSGESITASSIEETGPYPVFGGNGLRGYSSAFTHEGEHVLVGRQGALCGNVHIARGPFWASEHAVVVAPHGSNAVEWCGSLLEAMDLNQHSVAAAQPGLAVDRLRDLHVPVPPVPEQHVIADSLDHETTKIDAMIAKVNEAIERLNEYRTALISAAVTGKIDVRHHVDHMASDNTPPTQARP